MPPTKKKFTKIFDNLQEAIDVDDSRGRSVPSNMNFIEEGFLTKDKGSSLFGDTETALCHSDFNYKKKDGTEYRIRANGTYLQKYNTTTEEWENLGSGTATMTIANPAVVTQTAHGLKAGSKISFTTTGALPTGVTAGTIYYVLATDLSANTFKFSDTAGGTAIGTTGTQSGDHTLLRRYTADAEFGWLVYDDLLYGCNASENFFTFDGAKFIEFDGAPKGNILEVYEDRVFVTGVIAEPLSLYYSNVGVGTAFTVTDVVKPLGTDSVTNLKNYYGVLMIFKSKTIWKLTFVYEQVVAAFVPKIEQQSGNYGAVSRKAVSWVENDLWFFNGREVRAIGFVDQQSGVFGINKSVISEPIKETLAYLSNDNYSSVATFYNNRRFYLSVPLNSSVNDTVFVCHLLYKNSWTKYINRIKASVFDFVEVDDVIYTSKSSSPYGTVKWDEVLTADNAVAINSEVSFKKIENEDFNTFNTYRYLDLMFKDLSATVTVLIRQEASDVRISKTKAFYVGSVIEGEENSLGEVGSGEYWVADSFGESVSATPFLKKRVSFLSKAQSLIIGLSNANVDEDFTISAFALTGTQMNRRLFSGSKIISV